MAALALFDLDNTLLNGDSDHAWGEFLVEQGIVDSDYYKACNDGFYEDYKVGALDIHAYLAFALKPLTTLSLEELNSLHRQFMEDYILPMRLNKADKLLEKHKNLGHELIIITATNSFVTRPIAKALGVETILATEPELIEDQYTGNVAGTPCYQEGKVERLQAWLNDNSFNLDGSYFYSDSVNDLPLLKLVENPVAVDADERLTAIAKSYGWPTISLRD